MHYQFTYDCVWVYAKLTGQAGFRCGSALLECVFCASRSGLPFYSEGNLDGFHPVYMIFLCKFKIFKKIPRFSSSYYPNYNKYMHKINLFDMNGHVHDINGLMEKSEISKNMKIRLSFPINPICQCPAQKNSNHNQPGK